MVYMGLDARKSVFRVCKQQRRRLACASEHSDQHFCYSLIGKYHIHICYHSNGKNEINTRLLHLAYCSNKIRRKNW